MWILKIPNLYTKKQPLWLSFPKIFEGLGKLKDTEEGHTFSVRIIRNWKELSADQKKVKNVKSFKKK